MDETGICSHCLEEKVCRVWRRPAPAKVVFWPPPVFDLSAVPQTVEALICEKCLRNGPVLTMVEDILDAEVVE